MDGLLEFVAEMTEWISMIFSIDINNTLEECIVYSLWFFFKSTQTGLQAKAC